jgi:hypothetical protein
MVNQLMQGIKVEREHKNLYSMIKNCRAPCKISERKFYATIAKAHLKEDKHYYSKLAKAKL